MIEINKNPSRRELNWFGGLFALFFGVIGAMSWAKGSLVHATIVWAVAAAVVAVFVAVPSTRKPIYLAWTYAAYPIGWTVTNALLAATYFLVLTPIGIVMRLAGRDSMRKTFDPGAATYWTQRGPAPDDDGYFRQF